MLKFYLQLILLHDIIHSPTANVQQLEIVKDRKKNANKTNKQNKILHNVYVQQNKQ